MKNGKSHIIKNLYLGILLLSSVVVNAQQLKGRVIDAKTKETIPGANVYIPGTTIGTITDFNGNYTIDNVPTGDITVKCSLMSYQDQTVTTHINPGETKEINFSLSTSKVVLKTVRVATKRVENTENAIVAIQKKSVTMVNGISREQIEKIGGGSAASVLKKVTGVSVVDDKYVYIRGLSDRYIKTTLNNAEVPAMDPERNNVQMDWFPTAIIDNLIVYKTFSPDLPGDFSGGLVNIKTKSIPDKYSLTFALEAGYNPQANLNKHFLTYHGGKYDWLGMDDGSRKLPVNASGYIPARYENNELLNQITASFSKEWLPVEKTSPLNSKVSLSVSNKKKLFGKKFGYTINALHSNEYKYTDHAIYGRYHLVSPGDEELNPLKESYSYTVGKQDAIWSLMGNFGMDFSASSHINLLILNTHRGEKDAGHLSYIDNLNGNDLLGERRYLGFNSRNFSVAQLSGTHNFDKIKIRWQQSTIYIMQNEPNNRYLTNSIYVDNSGDTTYYVDKSLYPYPTTFYRNMEELGTTERIDLSIPYDLLGYTNSFKFGVNDNLKFRNYMQKKILFAQNMTHYYHNMEEYFENVDAATGLAVQGSPKDDQRNSYYGQQHIFAAYALTDIKISDKIKARAGIRMEKTDMLVESYLNEEATNSNSALKGTLNTLDILPGINLTYSPNNQTNIRASFSKTIARPSFREKSPLVIETQTGDVIVGNPNLLNTNITNFDLRAEKYFNSGELFSVGAFYKSLTNPIEKTFNTEAQNPEITWRNVENGFLYGVELEFAKKLSFIDALKDFKLSGNLTYVKSFVKVDPKELAIKQYYSKNYHTYRQMAEQPPIVANLTLSYKNPQKKIGINLTYFYEAKKLVIVNPKGIPDVYEKPNNNLNFNISKQLGNNYHITFAVNNILNNRHTYYYPYNGVYVYEDFGWGRNYSIKVSYTIK